MYTCTYTQAFHSFNFFCPAVLDEHLGIVPAKSLMTFYAEKVSTLEKGVAKIVCEHALSRLQSRIVSFEEQVSLDLCMFLFGITSPPPPPIGRAHA